MSTCIDFASKDLRILVENAIKRASKYCEWTGATSNGFWTSKVKEGLEAAGELAGYTVHGHRLREWSPSNSRDKIDLSWHSSGGEMPYLILESEWSHSDTEIVKDLNKVINGQAKHRVMIVDGDTDFKRHDHVVNLVKSTTMSGPKDQSYILVVVEGNYKSGVRVYEWTT